ncbi:hypothetical protein Ddye_000440 [Dipteronia dyeriana]|uniref:Uncharacterized protein n=1 Tax=Dipteronia dyeriana TaxID=168575 RepID=A0AAD9XM62_9ROSI|nr:hypothetical protein Ddye_000440 [Dipteronia dyeriana]
MVADTEVAFRMELQERGHEEKCTHTKRYKSKAVSKMQTTLRDVVDRLDGLVVNYGKITQATKFTICKFQRGFKEDLSFLTLEFYNLLTFIEHELQAIHTKVADVCTEWASHKTSLTVGFTATSSSSTSSAIQVLMAATYNDPRYQGAMESDRG